MVWYSRLGISAFVQPVCLQIRLQYCMSLYCMCGVSAEPCIALSPHPLCFYTFDRAIELFLPEGKELFFPLRMLQ